MYDYDSLEFQMYGYGGFGYDTSHVKRDDPEPEIVKAAKKGDLSKIRNLVERLETPSNPNPSLKLRLLINQTRRWTECDYKASGFVKTWEWHGLTALATAALEGHSDVVYYLLMVGADPTLVGCPTDDVYYDAFKAAEKCRDDKPGKAMVKKLLEAVRPFWNPAEYGKSAHYNKSRVTKGFPNVPTDFPKMLDALRETGTEYMKGLGIGAKDGPEPGIVKAAKRGDLSKIRNLVEGLEKQPNPIPSLKMRLLVNQTRRLTDTDSTLLDFQLNGFIMTLEWHGLTALATAAFEGHADVVYYLLMVGADPTLVGCRTDNVYYDAFKAAEKCHDVKPEKVLVKKLLEAVRPFWNPAEYGKSAQYDMSRVTMGFPNMPTDFRKMLDALRATGTEKMEGLCVDAKDGNANVMTTQEGKEHQTLNEAMDKMTVEPSLGNEEEGAEQDSRKMSDVKQPRARLEGKDGKVGANGKCWKHQRFGHKARGCAAPDTCKMKNSKPKTKNLTKKSA